MLLQEVGEEEEFQYGEDDDKLHDDDRPERSAQCHVSESVVVQIEDTIDESVLAHQFLRLKGLFITNHYLGIFLHNTVITTAIDVTHDGSFVLNVH